MAHSFDFEEHSLTTEEGRQRSSTPSINFPVAVRRGPVGDQALDTSVE